LDSRKEGLMYIIYTNKKCSKHLLRICVIIPKFVEVNELAKCLYETPAAMGMGHNLLSI